MVTYGIVGSRHWNDYAAFRTCLAGRGIEAVVSGGQFGVDQMAATWAGEGRLPFRSCPANDEQGATFTERARARNQKIADAADSLIAFPCQCSKGTWDTITRAKKRGIPVEVIRVDCGRKG